MATTKKDEKKRIKKEMKNIDKSSLADSLLEAAKVESLISSVDDEFKDIRDEENESARQKILQFVKMKEDIQKLRIATGNRVCASFNIQMGQAPGTKQEDMEADNLRLIEKLRKEYKRITDAYTDNSITIKKHVKNMAPEMEFIKSKLDYDVVAQYISLLEVEDKNKDSLKTVVHEHPLWDAFFANIKGLGEETAAVCIAYLDPYKARHASSFISFSGLNPVEIVEKDEDGEEILDENGVPKMKTIGNCKKFTVMRDYFDKKEGVWKKKKSITYNPMVKMKLLGVAAPCIIKANIKNIKDENGEQTGVQEISGKYANAYLDYRRRQTNKGIHPAHAHNRALRYMMKEVLKDCWNCWRKLEGLPVTLPYEQEFLGRAPHKWPNITVFDKNNNQFLSKDGKEVTGDEDEEEEW